LDRKIGIEGKIYMEKLFLASYFTGSVKLFTEFTQNSCSGKKVVFIPTASVPEKVTFFCGQR
jgi:dipeptidase E